uniref:SWIM-type domain-containing protein n=1 Tax=Lactuca sativa TaxID=4236 RepID=A0A9R1VBF1_LACSA|nr:hypothetical protein LSAT_V11C600331820 [Lactuca sativa]
MDDVVCLFTVILCCDTLHYVLRPRTFPPFLVLGCDNIYPVAWVVVAVEYKETWKWFLDLLIDDIGMGVGHELTRISDQHKGLVEAVKERVPAAEHRQCARHIYANFQKRFKGQIFRKLFWRASGSIIPQKFEYHMNEIKKLEPLAYEHLMERNPKTWCKAFSRFWQVVPSGYMQFEVRVGTDGYDVDLHTRQCGCRAWQLAGYPCVHGYAAISSLNRNPENYVSECFTTSMYARHNRSTCPQRPNDVPSTSGNVDVQVDIEAKLEVEHAFMFESEIPDVDVVPEMEANIEVPLVQDHIEEEIQDEVEHEIEVNIQEEVQDNVEQEIQDNAEIQVRKRTRKSSERITKIMLGKNIGRKEGSNNEHPLEI